MGDPLRVNHLGVINQPHRSTQPFILPGSINEYRQYAGGESVRITYVGWQVTLYDPIWQSHARRLVNVYALYKSTYTSVSLL